MRKLAFILIICVLLSSCGSNSSPETSAATALPITNDAIKETTVPATIPSLPSSTESIETESNDLTRFTLYTPNENADGFIATEVEGDKLTPMEVLIEAGVLTEDILLNEVMWEENGTQLTLDFGSAFRALVLSLGTAGEQMLIGSVVNTFLSAYQVDTVLITVEGEILESGHVVYDFPMGFFE